MNLVFEALENAHDKKAFSCGKKLLDNYLKKQAGQDVKRKLSACFICVSKETNHIKGYYTLSNSSIPLDTIPTEISKRLPASYHSIPCTLLGRLAVDKQFQGEGLGKLILIDALQRSYNVSKTLGSFAIIVDPIDIEAETFYKKFGFIKLPDSGKMFLAMKTLDGLF